MASKLGSWWQKSKLRSWWLKIKQHPARLVVIIAAGVLVVALIVAIILGYWLNWEWTGLGSYIPPTKGSNFQRAKTLWDWLQLLIIPVVLAVAGFWLNQIQKSREEKTTERRAKIEQETTLNNQRQAALQGYIDQMSELLLKEHLRESKPEDEVRKIARVRTLTVLQQLDAVRKFSVLLFLHESGLIDKGKCIVELDIANLQKADLQGVHLEEAQLRGAKLQGADLSFAYLSGADLKDANLHRANLIGADLREAYLEGVDLGGANLTGTNLKGATVTPEQLDKAKSIPGATMPDGSIHP